MEELYFFYLINNVIPSQSKEAYHQEINKIFGILSKMYQEKQYILSQKDLDLILNNFKNIYKDTYSEFLGTGKKIEWKKEHKPSPEDIRKARLEKIEKSKPMTRIHDQDIPEDFLLSLRQRKYMLTPQALKLIPSKEEEKEEEEN